MDILLDGIWGYKTFNEKTAKIINWHSLEWINANYETLDQIQIPNCEEDWSTNKSISFKVFYLKLPDIPYRPESYEYSIEFNGLNNHGTVWVNGHLIGEVTGGIVRNRLVFQPEILSIKKDNYLAVQVHRNCKYADLPFDKHAWQHCFGIFQSVELLILERSRVKKIRIRTDLPNRNAQYAKIQVDFLIKHPQEFFERCYAFQRDPQITYEIYYLGRFFNGEPQINPVLIQTDTLNVSSTNIDALKHVDHDFNALKEYFSDALDPNEVIEGTFDLAMYFSEPFSSQVRNKERLKPKFQDLEGEDFQLSNHFTFQLKNPILWTPENPNLYRLSFHLHGIDQDKHIRFGIRQISTFKNQIFLNHKLLRIHGICYPSQLDNTSIPKQRQEIIQIKNFGFNAIRLLHGAQDVQFLRMTDEEGILVMQDFMLNTHWSLKNQNSLKKVAKILSNFIYRDINRPSLIIWSLGSNIISQNRNVRTIVKKSVQLAKIWDRSRLITYSSPDKFLTPLRKYMDLQAIETRIPKNSAIRQKFYIFLYALYLKNKKNPLILSKFGVKIKKKASQQEKSEMNQLAVLQQIIPQIAQFSGIAGFFLFHYKDFRVKSSRRKSIKQYNNYGILRSNHNPRKIATSFPKLFEIHPDFPKMSLFVRCMQILLWIDEIFFGAIKKFFMLQQQ